MAYLSRYMHKDINCRMELNSIKIRKFKASDAEDCFRIRAESFVKLFYEEIGPDGVVLGINTYMPSKFIELAELAPFFVAVDKRTQLGFIASRFLNKTEIEILFLYVKLDLLGRGLGKSLVFYFEDWIQKNHPEIKRIIVDTAVPKYNQKFYEKIGYLKSGESECHYSDGSISSVRLIKRLI